MACSGTAFYRPILIYSHLEVSLVQILAGLNLSDITVHMVKYTTR
jgi:hypothetical protein